MQYERIQIVNKIRAKVAYPSTPFEHVIIATGSASGRCVDLVWNIFGFDPFGFRLTESWTGCDFCFVIVNGVMLTSPKPSLVEVPATGELLCKRSNLSTFAAAPPCTNLISLTRIENCAKAALLREQNANEAVISGIVAASLCDPLSERIFPIQLERRSTRMFGMKGDDSQFKDRLQQVLSIAIAELCPDTTESTVANDVRNEKADWATWLNIYRKTLHELHREFGQPTNRFVIETEVAYTDGTTESIRGNLPAPFSLIQDWR